MNTNVGKFLQNVLRRVFFCSAGHTGLSVGQPNQKLKRSARRNGSAATLEALESRTLLTSFSDQGALGMTGAIRGGAVWGDYDNDGDLDAVITGLADGNARVANIFRNDSGSFTNIAAGLANLSNGSASWGDYDRDGDLDLFISGVNSSGVSQSKLYRNTNGTFAEVATSFTGARYSSVAWGDFDNDGDLDLLLSGRSVNASSSAFTKIYRNDGGDTFAESSAALPGVALGSVAVGDYDNDGDLDVLISGTDTSGTRLTGIYKNNGDETFTAISAGLAVLNNSSAAWGDYDNDGDLDLLFIGQADGGQPESRIYRNDGGNTFTNIAAGLPGLFYGAVAWGDLDNDGDLDAVLTGRTVPTANITKVFVNNAGAFADDGSALTGFDLTSVAPGDYDNDGDLDLLIAGRDTGGGFTAKVYRNDVSTANTAPATPSNLTSSQSSSSSLTFSWSAPSDSQTASAGLCYNLRVGTTPGGSDVYASMANSSTGRRRVSQRGPIQGTSYTLKGLTAGQTYYWSVQAIDTNFAGSAFATESSAGINVAPTAVSASPNPASIAENTSTSSRVKVADLSVTDDGRGTNSLSLSGSDQASFEIVGAELFLRAGVALNFEAKTSYSVTVNVDDASLGSNPDASTTFTLNVTNVNEAPTAVTLQNTTTSLAEDASTAAAIKLADIVITDDALGTNSLSLSGTDAAFFEIVSNELRLKSGTVLNFEAKSTYDVTVEVNDAAVGGAVDASQNFTLTITDVNEAPTSLALQNTTTSLAEDTSTATAIKLADISVTDDVLGINSLSLSGTDATFFEIVSNELRLKSGTVLNFEAKSTYDVTVEVNDATVGGAVDASQNFTLTITDVNEAPTAVTLQNTTTSLAEDASTAAAIKLADIVITDDALGTNSLSLSGTDAAFFEIVSNELRLKSGTVLNFEAKSTYDVTVEVNDAAVGGAVDASQNFTLTITDVNEAPTSLALQNTTTSLAEDTSTATAIKLADISVTDDVLGINSLSLSGTDATFFEIVSNELRLKSGTVLNFEAKTTYDVTVEVNDATVGGAVDASQNFTLTITDVNEAPTALALQNTTTSLAEDANTTAAIKLADIVITDDALGTNSFSLSGTDATFFEIVSNELRLKSGTVLNFEAKTTYDVTVEVNDATVGGAVDASQNFTLTITDVNEAPTALTLQNTTTSLAEDASTTAAIKLADILVTDDALGTNALSLGGADAAFFEIVGNELRLVSGTVLDFETKSVYDVTVEVNDSAVGGSVDASVNFTLTLTDVLDPTAGADVFVLTFSSLDVTITRAINGGPAVSQGKFPLNSPVVLGGLDASDSVRIVGTAGDDSFSVSSAGIVVNGTTVTLTGPASRTLVGGAGNETYSFDADDVLGSFTLDESGGGIDTISFAATTTTRVVLNLSTAVAQTVQPTNLQLTLGSGSTFENATGGSGNDVLAGNARANILIGNDGNDGLFGGLGNDQLIGGRDNDIYLFVGATAGLEADTVTELPGGGTDTLSFASLTSDLLLNLASTAVQNVHTNRTLRLNSISDFENATGGSGNDTLVGSPEANVLTGNGGNDALFGGRGDDTLVGGQGDDIYHFSPVTGGPEADSVIELDNEGSDTLNFATITTDVTVALSLTTVQAVHTGRTLRLNSLSSFENANGGSGNDILVGNYAANIFNGNNGNDAFYGGRGGDTLTGGRGNDTYHFSPATAGSDSDTATELPGGGFDTLSFSTINSNVTLNLSLNTTQTVHENRTLLLNAVDTFENAVGGRGSDTLIGNALNNVLTGNGGHNQLTGLSGDDILVGSLGNDQLFGGAGRDILIGGAGLDSLDGGSEDDILIAGRPQPELSAASLLDLRTEWISTRLYTTRVANLRVGVGASLTSLQANVNVLNDSAADTLTGGSGTDWYFRAIDDVISDLFAGEIIDVLEPQLPR